MRCLDCHYSLKNLTEHRCPECGRAFDPLDARTYGMQPVFFPMRAVYEIGLLSYLCNLVFVYLLIDVRPGVPRDVVGTAFAALIALPFTFVAGIAIYAAIAFVREVFFNE